MFPHRLSSQDSPLAGDLDDYGVPSSLRRQSYNCLSPARPETPPVTGSSAVTGILRPMLSLSDQIDHT